MRGKVPVLNFFVKSARITPAYAGKSKDTYAEKYAEMGSPPPMRGKVFWATLSMPTRRITPAYAGKSSSASL